MARAPKLNTDLGDSSDPVFSDEITISNNTLDDNIGSFPDLPIDTATISGKLSEYNKVRLKPYYKAQVADTSDARKAVQQDFTKNGNWLNTFCAGNLALMKKTGYPFAKDDGAQGKLDQTTLSVTTVPNSALIDFYITHIKGGGIHYGIMITPVSNPETNPAKWGFYYASQREGTIPELERDTNYKMSSFAMGTDKELTYSAEVEITTL